MQLSYSNGSCGIPAARPVLEWHLILISLCIVIVFLKDDRILNGKNTELFVLEKDNETPLIALWCELDHERKNIHILNILGDRGSLRDAIGAWDALYPEWTVSGARRKSKQNVQYRLSEFTKQ